MEFEFCRLIVALEVDEGTAPVVLPAIPAVVHPAVLLLATVPAVMLRVLVEEDDR